LSRELRALVTGASSGIGAAFARGLARRGRKLVLVARRHERLRALVAELGEDVACDLALDLTAPGALARLEETLAERGFGIDVLVNNAGLGHTGRFHEAPPGRLLAIVDLDVRVVVELTRRLLPAMVERGHGRVVNVVSMSAFQPVPYLSVYAAAKAFVLSWSEALAAELEGSGVSVQALCPGLVPTEFQAVAGTDRVAFDRAPTLSAEAVAEASLRALDRGSMTLLPGWRDRLGVFAQRFVPRSLVRRVAGGLFRPPHDRL
jgi:short-subunit dehydrogenase